VIDIVAASFAGAMTLLWGWVELDGFRRRRQERHHRERLPELPRHVRIVGFCPRSPEQGAKQR